MANPLYLLINRIYEEGNRWPKSLKNYVPVLDCIPFFKAEGGYIGKERKVLFCAMNRRQVAMMREIIKDVDPKAFVLLTSIHDVMGYGFRSRSIDLTEE